MYEYEDSYRIAEDAYLQATNWERERHYSLVSADYEFVEAHLPPYMAREAVKDDSYNGYMFEMQAGAATFGRVLGNVLLADQKDLSRELRVMTSDMRHGEAPDITKFLGTIEAISEPERLARIRKGERDPSRWGDLAAQATLAVLRRLSDSELKEVAQSVNHSVYGRKMRVADPADPAYDTLRSGGSSGIAKFREGFTRSIRGELLSKDFNGKRYKPRVTDFVDEKAAKIHDALYPKFYLKRKDAYNAQISYDTLTNDPELAVELASAFSEVGVDGYYETRFNAHELMRDANYLFQKVLLEVGKQGSANAGPIIEILRAQEKSSLLAPVALANRLTAQLGGVITDEADQEVAVEKMDERNLANVPQAYFRILYVAQELGESTKSITDESKAQSRLLTQIAGFVFQAGFDKKVDQPVTTIGDVVMRFPDASEAELTEIMNQIELGGSIDQVQSKYQEARRAYGTHTYWNRNRAGYGVIS